MLCHVICGVVRTNWYNTNSDDGYASDPGVKGPAYGYYVMGLLSRVDKGLLTWLAMPIQSSVVID